MSSYPERWRERPDETQQPANRHGANSVRLTGRCERKNRSPFAFSKCKRSFFMIKISNLVKIYEKGDSKVKAIDGINLHVEKGDIYGIIGLSGAGKSSLVQCINRIEEPTSGSIVVSGSDVLSLGKEELRKARQNIGMIFQNFNLLTSRSVYENVAFPLRLRKLDENEIESRVMTLLEKVELSDKAKSYPNSLSGGQKQRVGIARALATSPDVLLCDEATSALDPKTTRQILELLKSLNEELGVTLVIITHEMEVIKAICNRVAILADGKVIEEGHTASLFSKVPTSETKAFLGGIETPDFLEVIGKRLHLIFSGESAHEPIISRFIKEYPYEVNILSGSVESIQRQVVGKLLIEVAYPNGEELSEIVKFFEKNNVIVEVLND